MSLTIFLGLCDHGKLKDFHGKVWDFHAWTTLGPRTLVVFLFVFVRCPPNVSNLSQPVWPKTVLNRNPWNYASTQNMSSVKILFWEFVITKCNFWQNTYVSRKHGSSSGWQGEKDNESKL